MTSTPRPDPGRTLTTPTPDLRQDPDMDMRCRRAWLHPSHHWIDTDSNGYLCDGIPEGAPPRLRATEGYGYGMPPTRTERVAVTLGAENVRHAFTTTPEPEPEGSRTAMDGLEEFLGDRAVYADRGLRWSEPYDTVQGELLTEAEVRTLTGLFVQLAQGPEPQSCQVCGLSFANGSCPSCGVAEKHEHDWKTQPLISGGSREVCLECGAVRA